MCKAYVFMFITQLKTSYIPFTDITNVVLCKVFSTGIWHGMIRYDTDRYDNLVIGAAWINLASHWAFMIAIVTRNKCHQCWDLNLFGLKQQKHVKTLTLSKDFASYWVMQNYHTKTLIPVIINMYLLLWVNDWDLYPVEWWGHIINHTLLCIHRVLRSLAPTCDGHVTRWHV